jgi:adhesin/invasin
MSRLPQIAGTRSGVGESGRCAGALLALAALGLALGLLVSSPRSAAAGPSSEATTAACPPSNPPDELTLVAGTPQTAKLNSSFATPFQVVLANTNGCPVTATVAGTVISFSAPSSGPSGAFAASGSSSVSVGTDATGAASAEGFSANDQPGTYTLTASSPYGSVVFSLTNTAAGLAATINPQPPSTRAAYVDTTYAEPLSALVLDANGNPVEGVPVTFSLGGGAAGAGNAGAASAPAATFAGGTSQVTATTNSSGLASSPLVTANATPGAVTATATVAGVAQPASFRLLNVAGAAPRIVPVSPATRTAPIDTRYAKPLEVTVLTAAGKPVEGATVTFSLGAAGGGAGGSASASPGATFVGGTTEATETTGPRGRASSPLFSADATPGTFSATAAVAGVINPVSFQLDNLAGRPPVLHVLGAEQRGALVGARYARSLQVRVLAADGKPLEGATVTFSLGAGATGGGGAAGAAAAAGAAFTDGAAQATETTDADGVATSPRFAANDTAGAFSATASVAGVVNPVSFQLDNLAGRPPVLHVLGGIERSAAAGSRYRRALQIKVLAADGTPVEGVSVTFALGSTASGAAAGAGGSGSGAAGASFLDGASQASETTDADGIATSPLFTANATAGLFNATASVSGVTNPASFVLDNLAVGPPTVAPVGPKTVAATVAERFAAPLRVRVLSAAGKPVEGATVSFTLGSGGANAAGAGVSGSAGASFVGGSAEATATTDAAGLAVSPAFSANTVAGSFSATAAVPGQMRPASFTLRNLAGSPVTVSAGAASGESTAVDSPFPVRLAVKVADRDSNPVAGVVVTFAAPRVGASGRFAGGRVTVRVRTDRDGVAVAPAFAANAVVGGYIVTARVPGASAAAFALVNETAGAG